MFDDREMSENQYLDEVYGDPEDDFEDEEDDSAEWDEEDDLEVL